MPRGRSDQPRGGTGDKEAAKNRSTGPNCASVQMFTTAYRQIRKPPSRESEDLAAARGVLTATILGMLVYAAIAFVLR